MKSLVCILLLFFNLFVYSQKERNLSLSDDQGKLFGSLLLADSENAPLVIIVPGSGPTDRDGNNAIAGKNNSLKMLAQHLYENNISTFRMDKRGVGESQNALLSEENLLFDHYVDDLVDWIHKLKKETNASKIIVAGHSEGSLIGMLAAKKTKADAYISIAGAGMKADSILKIQLSGQPEQLKTAAFEIIDKLAKGDTISEIHPFLYNLFRPSIQKYLINWFQYDPGKIIAELTVPVLIIQGENDLQVTKIDAEILHRNNKNSRLVLIKTMNHVLKNCSNNYQENMKTYANPDLPIDKTLINEIASFVKKL